MQEAPDLGLAEPLDNVLEAARSGPHRALLRGEDLACKYYSRGNPGILIGRCQALATHFGQPICSLEDVPTEVEEHEEPDEVDQERDGLADEVERAGMVCRILRPRAPPPTAPVTLVATAGGCGKDPG